MRSKKVHAGQQIWMYDRRRLPYMLMRHGHMPRFSHCKTCKISIGDCRSSGAEAIGHPSLSTLRSTAVGGPDCCQLCCPCGWNHKAHAHQGGQAALPRPQDCPRSDSRCTSHILCTAPLTWEGKRMGAAHPIQQHDSITAGLNCRSQHLEQTLLDACPAKVDNHHD